jgi:hypothetical protein
MTRPTQLIEGKCVVCHCLFLRNDGWDRGILSVIDATYGASFGILTFRAGVWSAQVSTEVAIA